MAASTAISPSIRRRAEEFFAKLKRALVTGYFVEDVGTRQARDRRGSGLRVLARRPPQRHAAGRFRSLPLDRRQRLRTVAGGPRPGLARRRPGPGAAGVAVRHASRAEDLHRPRAARHALRQRDCSTCLPNSASRAIGDTARLRWFLHKDAPRGARVARAQRRRRAHRAKLTGICHFPTGRRPTHGRPRSAMPRPATTHSNVQGGALAPCGNSPVTGFFRNGCCDTGHDDTGMHTVCAVMTTEFLALLEAGRQRPVHAASRHGFPGLAPGDRWCLCVGRWREALEAGVAPPVVLAATHEEALAVVVARGSRAPRRRG